MTKRVGCVCLYMAVTPDELELPLAVFDTAKELAARFSVSPGCVASCIKKNKSGKTTGRKFVRVEFYDEDLDEEDC